MPVCMPIPVVEFNSAQFLTNGAFFMATRTLTNALGHMATALPFTERHRDPWNPVTCNLYITRPTITSCN